LARLCAAAGGASHEAAAGGRVDAGETVHRAVDADGERHAVLVEARVGRAAKLLRAARVALFLAAERCEQGKVVCGGTVISRRRW